MSPLDQLCLFYFRLRHLNLAKNLIHTVPQLMLIEGRHVPTVLGSASTQGRRKKSGKTPRSAGRSRKSERKSPEKVKVYANILFVCTHKCCKITLFVFSDRSLFQLRDFFYIPAGKRQLKACIPRWGAHINSRSKPLISFYTHYLA